MTTNHSVINVIENLIKERGDQSKEGLIPFSRCTIGAEEIEAVMRVMTGTNNRDGNVWLAAGKETEAFEKEFARFVGVKYAIFTNSCTSALKLAYKWAVENKYKVAIVPRNTFCATYSAAREMGMVHCFRDELKSMGPRGCIKVNVHFGGVKETLPCIIEDSAHRIEPNDPLVGKIRCYSFYVTKNMTTGAGGMLVTNDKEIYDKCREYWRDGLSSTTKDRASGKWDYTVLSYAGGYDGNDIAAAIGREQLKKLTAFNKRREDIVRCYNEAFGTDWRGNHIYPYDCKSEDGVRSLLSYLKEKGIMGGWHYPGTSVSVSLPLYPSLKDTEVKKVIGEVKEWREEVGLC